MITINRLTIRKPDGGVLFEVERLQLDRDGKGRVFGVVGPSGCGKTTLLKALLGLLPHGQLGENDVVSGFSRPAYFSQRPVIFPHLTAEQNAIYFANTHEHRERHAQIVARAQELSEYLRVDFKRLNRVSSEKWSGGEQQRLALIRGLAIDPDVIFLDEPCNGLDPCVRWELLSFLRQHVLKHRLLAIYVSHYSDELVRISDEILTFSAAEGQNRRVARHSLAELMQAPAGVAEYIAAGNYVGAWADNHELGRLGIDVQRVYAPEDLEVRANASASRKIEQIYRFGRQAAHAVIELTGGVRLIVPAAALPLVGTPVAIGVRQST